MKSEFEDGVDLFVSCWRAPIDLVAIENPEMHDLARDRMPADLPKPQIVHPFWFGDPEYKATGWYLRGLAPLVATNRLPEPKRDHPKLSREVSEALSDIAAERQRQKEVEGWTPEHDDGHSKGELAAAAACYAVGRRIVEGSLRISERGLTKNLWPWSLKWWKPKDRRRDLVRAAALIVAEIERLDRLSRYHGGGVND